MQKEIRFGIIGLGLMGREFGSAVARWCHLTGTGARPKLTGICDRNTGTFGWFRENFPTIEVISEDYRELLRSDKIDAIYCAVPHNLHRELYTDIIEAGKHLLGEKPFGIDLAANDALMKVVNGHPDQVVRCSSEFPFFPGAKKVIDWLRDKRYGRLMEVRCGFHHASDMDLNKPLNWKRMVEVNGEYGVMGDLGLHTQHIPLRMGWVPDTVYADLLNIAEIRPDGKGGTAPCETWDNAVITCGCTDPDNGKRFSLVLETKRMAPGATNTWFIEVYGTEESVKFSTHEPKAFYRLRSTGKEQGWTRTDVGSQSFIPSVTGGIFEFGFSDAFQQMIGAFMSEFDEQAGQHPFGCVRPEETALSHAIMTAALQSYAAGRRISLES